MLAVILLPVLFMLQVSAQSRCATLVADDLARTQIDRPDVYGTIQGHTAEWSPMRKACVVVMQYRTRLKDGAPAVQILAINAATRQPMDGYKDIYLVPETDKKQIAAATSLLATRYSK